MSSLPEIDIVFVSGALNPEVWKHQERYFGRCSNVESLGGGEFREIRSELLNLLDNSENAVVVGAELGNHVVQEVEEHESVVSTVVTGPFDAPPFTSEKAFRFFNRVMQHPKIAKRMFFSEGSEYRVVKEFLHTAEFPGFEIYRSYIGRSLRVPVKNSLMIYNQNCRFSRMDAVEEMRPNSEIALLNAGSFSFFERPQEYNKALNDYLLGRKDILERRRLVKSATENRSLKEFEEKLELEQ
ncbi:MAG: hypothetical protein ACLFRK_00980 [Candidatus Nanohaloarchaea archaeon]